MQHLTSEWKHMSGFFQMFILINIHIFERKLLSGYLKIIFINHKILKESGL